MFLATVGLVLAAAAAARLMARRTTRPVRALTEATTRVAAGDLTVRIESERHDEIRTLVESFGVSGQPGPNDGRGRGHLADFDAVGLIGGRSEQGLGAGGGKGQQGGQGDEAGGSSCSEGWSCSGGVT